MSEVNLQTVQSQSLNAPVRFEDSAGTEIGTLCRAWVNFNGTGTVAIRASFNVLGITDNNTGDYTVNFTNALPDANYCANVTGAALGVTAIVASRYVNTATAQTTSAVRIGCTNGNTGTATDDANVNVSIFR